VASALRGQRKTAHGVEPVADPVTMRMNRRFAIQISVTALGMAVAATVGLIAV